MDETVKVGVAAAYLCLSRHTVYKLASKHRITHVKLGRALRFRKTDLDKYLARNAVAEYSGN